VTAGQYTDFLNAKANVSDPYGLYNTDMSRTDNGSGIMRSLVSGSYAYTVASDFVNRPVNYVSFWDSCRFANWLGNGQGAGSTETGAYTLTADGIANNTITRNAGARWAVTNEDEWYKAAYYKGGSTIAGYWMYPTSSNTAPGRDMADASGNNANIYMGSGAYPIDSGKFTTVAGEFQNSDSAYGTFDQGGNVWEWNEAKTSSTYRGFRGGALDGPDVYLQASFLTGYYPAYETSGIGFRVAEVAPEPSSIIALAGGLISLLGMRRRRA
jgi:formylglycine-generating enzyme required for sulfatase activity